MINQSVDEPKPSTIESAAASGVEDVVRVDGQRAEGERQRAHQLTRKAPESQNTELRRREAAFAELERSIDPVREPEELEEKDDVEVTRK